MESLGLLRSDAKAVSFGAGRERLLFAIAPRIATMLATDFYSHDTGWGTARVGAKHELGDWIRKKAIEDRPYANLDAQRMDMRDLSSLNDDHFDFAYSSCAVEHIGDPPDFQRHFAEVARVLKPNGYYAFTTEFLLNRDENQGVASNYKFAPADLVQMFNDSDLEPMLDFDATLSDHEFNRPRLEGEAIASVPVLPNMVIAKQGLVFSSCLIVAKPRTNQPTGTSIRYRHLTAAQRWATAQYEHRLSAALNEGITLDLTRNAKNRASTSGWLGLGDGRRALSGIPRGATIRVVERRPINPKSKRKTVLKATADDQPLVVPTSALMCYQIIIDGSSTTPASVDVHSVE